MEIQPRLVASESASVVGAGHDTVEQELRRPEIMGTIIPQAWSSEALSYAEGLTTNSDFDRPGMTKRLFRNSVDFPPSIGREAFQKEFRAYQRLFQSIGGRLLKEAVFGNRSRLESEGDLYFTRWHYDGWGLTMFSVPSGTAMKYFPFKCKHAGRSKKDMDAQARDLPENSVIIFKGKSYPHAKEMRKKGLLHRAPYPEIKSSCIQNRLLMHMTLLP